MNNKYLEKFLNGPTPFDLELEMIRAQYVQKTISFHSHKHILDVGSGPCAGFLKFDGWETYTVVEPIKEFCEILSDSSLRQKNKVVIVNSTLENAILPQKHYDCVILSSVLHLVKNDIVFLDKIHDICAEKNIVHINVPNKLSIHRILGLRMGILQSLDLLGDKDREYGHYHIYSIKELRDLLMSCGFDIRQTGSYLIKPFDEEKMSEIIDRMIVRGLEKLVEDFKGYGCELYVEAKAIG